MTNQEIVKAVLSKDSSALNGLKEKFKEKVSEAMKKLKSEPELGSGKKGTYYLNSVGYDSNGNWSYMVSKGANKPKKIQHQGEWREKLTSDMSDKEIEGSKTSKEIIDYYEQFLREKFNETKKSKEASSVLQLMDKDYTYQEALNKVLKDNPKINKTNLEKELDIYI